MNAPAAAGFKPDPRFTTLAEEEVIARTRKALEDNGFQVLVADSGTAARDLVLSLIPEGAEVMTNSSRTLDDIGVSAAINESGKYDAVRPKLMAILGDPSKKREQRKVAAAPDYAVGSVHAISEDGVLFIASGTGSQLGQYAYAAGNVILVAGTHKIVADSAAAHERIHAHSLPLEHERALAAYGRGSAVAKLLTISADRVPGRSTVVLIKEHLGF